MVVKQRRPVKRKEPIMANVTTSNTNATVNNDRIATFVIENGKKQITLDPTSERDLITTFGTPTKISFEEAHAPENKDAWKKVRDFVSRPEDHDGMGLASLKGMKNLKDFEDMCDLFLELGVKMGYLEARAADKTTVKEEKTKPDPKSTHKEFNKNNYKNSDGSVKSIATAAEEWAKDMFDDYVKDLTDNVKKYGKKTFDELKRTEREAREDMYNSFGEEDSKLAEILRGIYDSMDRIKDFNSIAYNKIKRLYMKHGFARMMEIRHILSSCVSNCYAFVTDDEETIISHIEKYNEAGKTLIMYTYKLRLWMKKCAKKVSKVLGCEVEGTIANRVAKLLKGLFNVVVYGTRVLVEIVTVVVSGITSLAFTIGGKLYEGVCWLISKAKVLGSKAKAKLREKAEFDYNEDPGYERHLEEMAATVEDPYSGEEFDIENAVVVQ